MRFSTAVRPLLLLCVSEVRSFSPLQFSFAATGAAPSETTKKSLSKEEVRKIQDEAEEKIKQNHDNDAWNALFVSCPERATPAPIVETEGSIPSDFPPGSLLRLGPNGADATEGFFDGDGMVQCITFPPDSQQSTFSATYVDTKGRQLEKATGFTKKFKGTLRGVPQGYPMLGSIFENAINFQTLQAQKDTCNTALAEHGGRILALMEQCPPTEIEITRSGKVNTVEACLSLNGAIDTSTPISGGVLSAHGRTCPKTGDRVHVSYRSDAKPFLRVDTFAPGWDLKQSQGIDIPTPIFLHDSVLTENYVVIFDLPLTLRVSRILRNKFPVEYEPSGPARIGLVPRSGGETVWFDCDPGVILHASNAWETDDDKVIIQAFRGEPSGGCYLNQFNPNYYHEYSLDLKTGTVQEKNLNAQEIVEFPVINDKLSGKACSATYALSTLSVGGPLKVYTQPNTGVTFDSVVKFAALAGDGYEKGDVIGRFQLQDRWFCVSEPTVVPKVGQEGEGEYILLIASHVPEGVTWEDVANDYDGSPLTSKVFLLDGDDLDVGPQYSASLPFHVPYGLHSGYIDWEHMK